MTRPARQHPLVPRRSSVLVASALAAALLIACGQGKGQGQEREAGPEASAGTSSPGAAQAAPARAEPRPADRGRPLPAFRGRLLDGREVGISDFVGKRLVLFFFNPEAEESEPVARAVAALAPERSRHNFEILGVAMAAPPSVSRAFAEGHGLDVPIFDDSSARIAGRVGLRSPVAILGVDAEAYLSFARAAFATDAPDAAPLIEEDLREMLRLPDAADEDGAGALGFRPAAPLFEVPRIDEGGGRIRLADLQGRAVVLVFFLHTCPHCHHALRFFQETLAELPEDRRPALLGISVRDERPSEVRMFLAEEGIEPFPVGIDPDESVRGDYGVFGVVPDIALIDREGRIAHRIRGWEEGRDPAIARMITARIAGAPTPMLLNPRGYTGSDVCGVCHEQAHGTWEYTSHATAFDTLVAHGADRDAECVGCHVVGFGEPGGWSLEERPAHLEGVGCESCHGRGGPHLSPQAVPAEGYAAVCGSCHDQTHSLGFEFAGFLPKVSHAALAALSDEERRALAASHGKPRDLLPATSEVVGSEACKSCHAAEFATWEASPHGHAVETLAEKGKAGDADCLRCHTTAYGKPGGFPAGAAVSDHGDLARVGCESCHGPGGEHVKEGSRKLGSIVSLGDKCDSCVILQICGSCHDEANDPGFRFSVEERIEAQRHGTIEAGTGKPRETQARLLRSRPEVGLAHAFGLLDERG